MLNSSRRLRSPDRITHPLQNFGLFGFSRGANVGVVLRIFPSWTANSSRIRSKIWGVSIQMLKNLVEFSLDVVAGKHIENS